MITTYYLHANGDLIHKPNADRADLEDSDFVTTYWILDTEERADAWSFAVQALAAGASRERVQEVANKWGLTPGDAHVFADRMGLSLSSNAGACIAEVAGSSGALAPRGYGSTSLDAMAELCSELGYMATNPPGWGLADLVKQERDSAGVQP